MMKKGDEKWKNTQQKDNECKDRRTHVKDKLDTGNTEYSKKGYNMKKPRKGGMILRGMRSMKNVESLRSAYMDETGVDSETKNNGVEEEC